MQGRRDKKTNTYKQRWCRARDLFGLQVPVTTGGFELQFSCIQSRYVCRTRIPE